MGDLFQPSGSTSCEFEIADFMLGISWRRKGCRRVSQPPRRLLSTLIYRRVRERTGNLYMTAAVLKEILGSGTIFPLDTVRFSNAVENWIRQLEPKQPRSEPGAVSWTGMYIMGLHAGSTHLSQSKPLWCLIQAVEFRANATITMLRQYENTSTLQVSPQQALRRKGVSNGPQCGEAPVTTCRPDTRDQQINLVGSYNRISSSSVFVWRDVRFTSLASPADRRDQIATSRFVLPVSGWLCANHEADLMPGRGT